MKDYSKHTILEAIFNSKFNGDTSIQPEIMIYFDDITNAAMQIDMKLPVSYSNFVLDLCRKNLGIARRVPKVVRDAGYDLMKATGRGKNGLAKSF